VIVSSCGCEKIRNERVRRVVHCSHEQITTRLKKAVEPFQKKATGPDPEREKLAAQTQEYFNYLKEARRSVLATGDPQYLEILRKQLAEGVGNEPEQRP
jgi:precorrin-6B methylase 1